MTSLLKLTLFLILIVTPQCSHSMTWNFYRNVPSSCCQTYPATTPPPVKCVPCPPPTTVLPPKEYKPTIEPCCVPPVKTCKPCAYPVKIIANTTPAPPLYTPSPCLPPTCYTNLEAQKAEIEKIYKQGSQLMVDYSDAATGPVVYAAQTISNGADLIPSIFSAGGDFLGKAIAAPIQFFNRLGFSLLTGTISQVVTIPISLGTSVRASTVLLQPYLRWFGLGGSEEPHTCCPTPPTPGTFEQIGLKPLGTLTGPIHLALGSFLSLGGSTFRLIGTLTKNGGEYLENTGHGFKNVGALKVADGIKSVASFLGTVNNPKSQTICIDNGKTLSFYSEVKPTKKPVPVYTQTTVAPYVPPVTTEKPYIAITTKAPYTTTPAPYTKAEIKIVTKPVVTTPYPTQAPTTVKIELPKIKVTTPVPPPPPTTSYVAEIPKFEDVNMPTLPLNYGTELDYDPKNEEKPIDDLNKDDENEDDK